MEQTVDRLAAEMEADAQRLTGPVVLRDMQRILNVLAIPTSTVFSAAAKPGLRTDDDINSVDDLLAQLTWLGLSVLARCDLAREAQKDHQDGTAFQHLLDGDIRLRFMTELVLCYMYELERKNSISPGRAMAVKRHEKTRTQNTKLEQIVWDSPELHKRISADNLATILLERLPPELRRSHRFVADLIRTARRKPRRPRRVK